MLCPSVIRATSSIRPPEGPTLNRCGGKTQWPINTYSLNHRLTAFNEDSAISGDAKFMARRQGLLRRLVGGACLDSFFMHKRAASRAQGKFRRSSESHLEIPERTLFKGAERALFGRARS